MKKVMFLAVLFGFWYLAWTTPMRGFGPELLKAQGFGLRVDTPHGRIAAFDRGGHWIGERRGRVIVVERNYFPMPLPPVPYYDYGPYYPPAAYSYNGLSIGSLPPGTNLHIEEKGGGIFCLWEGVGLIGCGSKKVDLTTQPMPPPVAPAQQQVVYVPQPAPPQYSPPQPGPMAVSQRKTCDEKIICVYVSGGGDLERNEIKRLVVARGYILTDSEERADYHFRITLSEHFGDPNFRLILERVDLANGILRPFESLPKHYPPKNPDKKREAVLQAANEVMAKAVEGI